MNGMLNLGVLVDHERAMLRGNWGWFVGLGAVLAVMGAAALIFVGATTLIATVFVGWLFLIGGLLEVVNAILRKGWKGVWLDLISGAITGLVGLFIVMHPLKGASVLTIVIGVLFLIGGIFRIAAGAALKCPYSGWFVVHGFISSLLGIMILAQWPESLVWVIGTLVGIDLLVDGMRLISFGLAVKRLAPASETPAQQS